MTEMVVARCRGDDGAGIGADGEEAGDADVELPGEAPLYVEAEAQHGNDDQDCIGIFGFGLVLHGAHYPRMINLILLLICDK